MAKRWCVDEEPLGQRAIDDRDRSSPIVIGRRERTSGGEREPERAEVIRRDALKMRERTARFFDRVAFDLERLSEQPSTQRKARRRRCVFDAGQGGDAFESGAMKRALAQRRRISSGRKRHTHREHVVRIEPGIHT